MKMIGVVVCVAGIASSALAQEIPAQVLNDLKRGTVFLRVQAGSRTASGSGFLVHVDGATGLLVTNHHVVMVPVTVGRLIQSTRLVPASSVHAVFFSGTKDEVAYPAEILATIPDTDLTILRVKDAKALPKPLLFAPEVALTETMPVFSIGYPFGKLLGTDGNNPTATISKGTVSSLRRNKAGDLIGIQIDGALNPGNSGGPVVDKEGRIVGVAVKAILGAQIGMAIPAAEVSKVMNGRVLGTKYEITKVEAGGVDFKLEVSLADPLHRLRSISFQYLREGALKVKPGKGQLAQLEGAAKRELTVADQKAKATIRLPDAEADDSYWYQVSFVDYAGQVRFLEPERFRADPNESSPTLQAGELDDLKGKAMVVLFTVKDQKVRENAIEQIKTMVGNPLKVTRASTLNGKTTLQISPVNDPKAFVEKLKEIGKVAKVEGANVTLQVDPANVKAPQSDVAKDAGKAIELKNDKGNADFAGAIFKSDPLYKMRKHKLLLFEMEAGKIYQIEMKSTATSCCLFVEDPKGSLLVKNGPNGGDRDSRVTVTATASGKHRIIAGSFGAIGGEFTLSVRQVDGAKK
jgi:S1-C subfamily serine protease